MNGVELLVAVCGAQCAVRGVRCAVCVVRSSHSFTVIRVPADAKVFFSLLVIINLE